MFDNSDLEQIYDAINAISPTPYIPTSVFILAGLYATAAQFYFDVDAFQSAHPSWEIVQVCISVNNPIVPDGYTGAIIYIKH